MADMKKETDKIKTKYAKKSLFSTGPSPIRMLGQYVANKQMEKKGKEEINKLIMQVDDLKLDGETNERKEYINKLINEAKYKMHLEKQEKRTILDKRKKTILG